MSSDFYCLSIYSFSTNNLRKNKNSWWGPKDLSGKELYKIIGKPQPLYDFEQKDEAAKPA